MDNANLELIQEIRESFNNFEKDGNISFLEYAFTCYNDLKFPLEEEKSDLRNTFMNCPDEYLRLIASKDILFLKENSKNIDSEYFFEWDIFMVGENIGEENFRKYISYIFEAIPLNEIDDISIFFLRFIQDELFFGGKEAFNIACEITTKYDSWLANSLLAIQYFDEQNYENAIVFINKSNIWLKEDIEHYISESKNNPMMGHIADDLKCSLSTNINLEIESYYFGNECDYCIEFCDSILNSRDATLISILDYDCNFFKAFSFCELLKYNDALLSIDKALKLDDKYLRERNQEAIMLKLFLLEKLKKYDRKIALINKLPEIDINLYLKYSFQLDRLKQKQIISPDDEHEEKIKLMRPTLDKKISRRLIGNISYSGNEFTSEKLMEAFITSYIDRNLSIFGRQFSIFKNENAFGRQFRIVNGVIDLLLVEKNTDDLYIIELKKDKGYNNPIEQMKFYRQFVKEKIANPNQNVFGIICLSECNEPLKSLVKCEGWIELFSYDFLFRKEA